MTKKPQAARIAEATSQAAQETAQLQQEGAAEEAAGDVQIAAGPEAIDETVAAEAPAPDALAGDAPAPSYTLTIDNQRQERNPLNFDATIDSLAPSPPYRALVDHDPKFALHPWLAEAGARADLDPQGMHGMLSFNPPIVLPAELGEALPDAVYQGDGLRWQLTIEGGAIVRGVRDDLTAERHPPEMVAIVYAGE